MKKRAPAKRRGAPGAPVPRAPAPRAPGYDDIMAITRLIESGSRFTEFRLRSGDIEVEVKRAAGTPAPAPRPADAPSAETGPAAPPGVTLSDIPAGTHLIRSPMVGTFYRAPEPGAKPFVEVGTKVRADSIVCIIEVMKLMNSVEAGIKGTVTHVFVENAQMVEFGQPMIAIKRT